MGKISSFELRETGLDVAKVTLPDGDVEITELQVALDVVGLHAIDNNVVPGPTQFAEDIFNVLA
jgi:hypothetical protein